MGLFALRFVLLASGIFLTLAAGAHPVALLIGLSIAMPAVLIDSWLQRPRPLAADSLPALASDDPSWDAYSVWRAGETRAPRENDADTQREEPR